MISYHCRQGVHGECADICKCKCHEYKPVKAWAVLDRGKLVSAFKSKNLAWVDGLSYFDPDIVRAEIRLTPSKPLLPQSKKQTKNSKT